MKGSEISRISACPSHWADSSSFLARRRRGWVIARVERDILQSRIRQGVVSLLGASSFLLSFGALADNLLDVYRKAQERDPTYRGAAHALQAARERVPQARAGLLPAVNLVVATSQQ